MASCLARKSRLPYLWLAALFCIAFLVRMFHVASPREVIFDEVHFGKFTLAYAQTLDRIFDIHPPLGKIAFALAGKFGGMDPGFTFEKIGAPIPASVNIFALRAVSVLFGSLVAVLIAVILFQCNIHSWVVFTIGLFVALDNGFIVQSRIIALESELHAWTLLVISCSLAGVKAQKLKYLWFVLAGIFLGCAVGTKWTALFLIPFLAILFTVNSHWKFGSVAQNLAVAVCVGVFVYVSGWYYHFNVLQNPGFQDAFYSLTHHFFQDVLKIHPVMFNANRTIASVHTDGSPAWGWPFMYRAILFWAKEPARIYLWANPAVWLSQTLLLVYALFRVVQKKQWRRLQNNTGMFLIGFCLSFFPFLMIHRVLFIYHYFTPLLMLMMFNASYYNEYLKSRPKVLGCSLAAVAISYVVLIPATYGLNVGVWTTSLNNFIHYLHEVQL